MGLNLAVQCLKRAYKSESNLLFIGVYFKAGEGEKFNSYEVILYEKSEVSWAISDKFFTN